MTEQKEMLVKRIDENERKLSDVRKLQRNRTYKRVIKDLLNQMDFIDQHWHTVIDETRLMQLRTTKMAISHLLNLDKQYEQDIKQCKLELQKINNIKNEIARDYDLETNIDVTAKETKGYDYE